MVRALLEGLSCPVVILKEFYAFRTTAAHGANASQRECGCLANPSMQRVQSLGDSAHTLSPGRTTINETNSNTSEVRLARMKKIS